MKARMWALIGGVIVALAAALAVGSAALAQGPGYNAGMMPMSLMNGTPMMRGPGGGMGGPMMGRDQSLIAVAATQLGMERTALVAELQAGKTIAQLAAERNIALDAIVDAFIAPRTERMATMVQSGRLTQAQADAMLVTMRANVTTRLNQNFTPQCSGTGPGFVDQNGDGVCDRAGTGSGFVDQNGDGVCDRAGTGPGGMGQGRRGGR